MFSKTLFQTLVSYHWHTQARLLDCAGRLSQADYFANPGYGHGSIHDLFYHLLRATRNWRIGLETGQRPQPLPKEDFPDLASIRAWADSERQAYAALLERLTPAEIEGELRLTDRHGNTSTIPRWRILEHVILHGMQHHSEIAQLLTLKGQSPGDIDFILYT
jgi:uncharacterized damage-inducible protein DinB